MILPPEHALSGTHKILGPKNLSKNCQVDKYLTSLTCHYAGDEKDKPWRVKICQIEDPNQSYWLFFDNLDDPRDFVCTQNAGMS